MNEKPSIKVIGAGLAGCEAAYQAAKLGVKVDLYEMKPVKFSPAHHNSDFAELVCSNSLRSNDPSNAVGLLKAELSELGSLIMEAAYATAVPAGSALAVNRNDFSRYITEKIKSCENITVHNEEVDKILDKLAATAPLAVKGLKEQLYLQENVGIEAAYRKEYDLCIGLMGSKDFQNAVKSFMKKEKLRHRCAQRELHGKIWAEDDHL